MFVIEFVVLDEVLLCSALRYVYRNYVIQILKQRALTIDAANLIFRSGISKFSFNNNKKKGNNKILTYYAMHIVC